METLFLGVVAFLIVLAVFDLVVGVGNDAVNFLNSAIGARVARFRTIVIVAAVGVFAGAAFSNGMMDVARHGIMTPMYFSFYDVMCVFLAVMLTDVVLLDVFNTLGMPTSTTVSLVFELLGGAFAIALIKIARGATDASGALLGLGDLLNTEKAISVIMAIFLSVALAFVLGTLLQWLARLAFTFTYGTSGRAGSRLVSSVKIGVFAGVAVTSIIWFLLIKGLKDSAFMTPELKTLISYHTWHIVGGGVLGFSALMTLLSAFRVPVLKFVVLLGTFALAMAFAGNDLVNFVGVPLAGLDAYQDFVANGAGNPEGYLMESLMGNAKTPLLYLMLAGLVMVLALVFSKKAQNVVKTAVDLSRQDEGDEMFGSSGVARTLVRTTMRAGQTLSSLVPRPLARWMDSRFNAESAVLAEGAAFDQVRAATNLVVAGLLIAIGTSFKLPLSTTYVTFMVAMGSSLADRAWSRESAVFRITGVLSVIGGWFITAGAAFIVCYLITTFIFFGHVVAMALSIALAVFVLVRSNIRYTKKQREEQEDVLFKQILHSQDTKRNWTLLCQHVCLYSAQRLSFAARCYDTVSVSFFREQYRPLKRSVNELDEQRKQFKRQRRREILSLRRIDPILAVERNTWYFLSANAVAQVLYCLKRLAEPCLEHVGNNFSPVPEEYAEPFLAYSRETVRLVERAVEMLEHGDFAEAETLRTDADRLQRTFSSFRKTLIDHIQTRPLNLEAMTVLLNLVQESQELLGSLRHMVRGMRRFVEG